MKKILLSLCLISGLNIGFTSPTYASSDVLRTQADVKDLHKGMFHVITYNKEGNLLHSGNGFFIDENGTGIAAFSLFKEAHKAVVVDYKGNQLPVHRILGANSTYDLVKFSIEGKPKISAFNMNNGTDPSVESSVQLINYTGKKKNSPIAAEIKNVDAFEKYLYFKISAENVEKNFGCPLLNSEGNVVAVVQKNVEANAQEACAIDARFIQELEITNTSILNADLNDIHISKGLPDTEKNALTYIYMLGNQDSTAAIHAINDFIESYPKNAEGYVQRGTLYAQYNDFSHSETDFETAFEMAGNKESTIKADEIHNNLSKLIYNMVVSNPQSIYEKWTLDTAINEAKQAFEINPSPHYLLQQAHCYLAKKEYLTAYEHYKKINLEKFSHHAEWSAHAKAETWLFAARAYEMNMNTPTSNVNIQDTLKVITLLDSAIAALPEPYSVNDSKIFFERAQRNEAIKQYRKAVMDYYEYEKIIGPRNLNDKFYYLREQAELKCHMYQQALDDINTAIAFNPQDPFYPIEKGVVLLQAGMFQEAIDVCKTSLTTLPENPDSYKIMGICYGELKKKKEALLYLKKAQDLGDPTVQPFIDKYK